MRGQVVSSQRLQPGRLPGAAELDEMCWVAASRTNASGIGDCKHHPLPPKETTPSFLTVVVEATCPHLGRDICRVSARARATVEEEEGGVGGQRWSAWGGLGHQNRKNAVGSRPKGITASKI